MTGRPQDLGRPTGEAGRAARFSFGGEALLVVSAPLAEECLTVLTPAERAVALAAVEGLSNAAIAERRSASARTVANQLASVFRKLGVFSRAELAAHLHGGRGGPGDG